MTALDRDISYFKIAVALSIAFHLTLLLAALFSPQLPKPSRKEMIHYVNLISLPGGGGGGGGGSGGGEKIAETPLPKKETLKDLTTPQKISEEPSSSLRHPVEKPEKEAKPKPEKKAAIQKQETSGEPGEPGAKGETEAGSGSGVGGGGSGIRIGGGSGEGSEASGSSFASQIGLSNFPYTYYLQIIIDRVSSQWFTSLVDPGISGTFQATAYFKILRSGQISELKIQESSGVQSLDMSALRAIRSAAPFPPLPRDYEGEHLVIYLIFEHSK